MNTTPRTTARVSPRLLLLVALHVGMLTLTACASVPSARGSAGPPSSAACPPPVTRLTDVLPDGRALSAAFDSLLLLVPGGGSTADPKLGPYTAPPRPANLSQVAKLLQRNYPPDLAASRSGGQVQVAFPIGTDGIPISPRVTGTSGHPGLDQASVRVAEGMRFHPARNERCAVPFFMVLPITWALDGSGPR